MSKHVSWFEHIPHSLQSIMRQWNGHLTQELHLQTGPHGLGKLPERLMPEKVTTAVCGFCSTGCGLHLHLKEQSAINTSPAAQYPVNLGKACPKGWEALSPLHSTDRATTPYLRNEAGQLQAVEWDTALKTFTQRFQDIQARYGKESVAFLSTGQMATEEMALLGALTKFGMGIVHGDGNTRQCMATAVVAYKQAFGFDAPPYTYQDFEASDVLVFVGANPCIAHPIMWERVCMNRHNPKIIVVDPRRTETAMYATHHYALNPKSDLMLFYGVAHLLFQYGWIDEHFLTQHAQGWEDFRTFVQAYSPDVVAQETGINMEQLQEFAEMIHHGKRVSFWWTMGVNQSHQGVRTAQALINLALMTGNIGRVGTGANSITGQCNAMGSRLFSNTTNLLGGHDFLNPEHRRKIANVLHIEESHIPQANSWSYDQIIEGIELGKIRGLWVIATNPAHSWIHQSQLSQLLNQLDFLVVQDMYHTTETAEVADLILPAAGWGEKEGTFINSERRIGRIKKVSKAPGVALADFYIFKLIAEYWGCGHLFWEWESPEASFQILKRLSKGQPCDITGIKDYAMLDQYGGIQWPLPEGIVLDCNERRLFENKQFYHPDGKARFWFDAPQPHPEPTDVEYPFLLLTGRGTSAQWHTQTRTQKSSVLRKLYPEDVYVELNPEDATALNVQSNDTVRITSRRGHLEARAVLHATVQRGQLFIPMHYPVTNQLTHPTFDPHSRQPAYKACAVNVESQVMERRMQ